MAALFVLSGHTNPAVAMIGTLIGHYLVKERLGEGGMGEVFLVEDQKLHRRAALKLIRADLTRDATRRQRFLQEATLAASIDHPHICAIYDIDEADGRTFIAMEYVEGRPLRELLRQGPLTLRRALDLALQMADALAKVHERGVVAISSPTTSSSRMTATQRSSTLALPSWSIRWRARAWPMTPPPTAKCTSALPTASCSGRWATCRPSK